MSRALLLLALAIILAAPACTPIELPDESAPPPLEIGEPLPDAVLGRGSSPPWSLSELAGGPVVLTFLRPHGAGPRSEPGARLLARIGDALDRLRDDVAADTKVLVVLLDGPGGELPVGVRPGWRVVDTPRETLRRLAARLGVMFWKGPADLPGQTFATVVVDARLRFATRFPGVDGWTAGDLVGAIVAAASP